MSQKHCSWIKSSHSNLDFDRILLNIRGKIMNSFKSFGLIGLLSIFIAIPSFANIMVSPSAVMFGSVKVGMTQFRTVNVYNNGGESVNLQVSAGCPMDIHVNNGCYSVYPNGSCSININYRPSRPGGSFCSVNVRDSLGSFSSVNVSGNGVK